jgi:hypothetical protein
MTSEVLWDADPDTSAGIMDPARSDAAPSRRMTFLSTLGAAKGRGDDDGRMTLRGSAGVVLVSLALLWVLGGVVFKDARL